MSEMLETVRPYLNFTQLCVVVSVVSALVRLPMTNLNKILISILLVCLLNEIASLIFMINHIPTGLLVTITSTIHNSLWMLLMYKVAKRPGMLWCIWVYLTIAVCNIAFYDGPRAFNFETFILGALLYVVCFIYESFHQLKTEKFSFFTADDFILLLSPVLFFIGLSFVFGFKSTALSTTPIIGTMTLYGIIGLFVNIVYYVLINIYIFKKTD